MSANARSRQARTHASPVPSRGRAGSSRARDLLFALPWLAALGAACVDPGTDSPADSCPASASDPIVHSGALAADEVWDATAPHLVESAVAVEGGRTLTIAPCAEVRLAPGASIDVSSDTPAVTSQLLAEGTAEEPIRLVRADAGQPWSAVGSEFGRESPVLGVEKFDEETGKTDIHQRAANGGEKSAS